MRELIYRLGGGICIYRYPSNKIEAYRLQKDPITFKEIEYHIGTYNNLEDAQNNLSY